jgi:glycerol-3-phosphate O-acyltransferase
MFPKRGWWILAALALLGVLLSLLRKAIRRWAWRHSVRTRRSLGFRPRLITFTRKQRLKNELLSDARLRDFIRQRAKETKREEGDLLAEVSEYLDEIIPSFNLLTTYRFGQKIAGGLLRFLYRVRVTRSAESELSQIPRDASVVYVMNHRSNADYLLVAFLLANRVAISYAVGEWARVWPLEKLFRSFGSFFVRRHYREPLYHAVLERYVQRAVESGITQGIFLEGGLSRDGHLQTPKLGLLDYVLRADADKLVFIPVGINYDRVLEDSNLLRENAGLPRRGLFSLLRRTAFWLLGLIWRGASGRLFRFGYAIANFGAPIRVKEVLGEDLRTLDWDARKPHLEHVAEKLMRSIAQEIPITPVALVARSFRKLAAKQISFETLKQCTLDELTHVTALELPLHMARRHPERVFELGLRILVLRGILVQEGDALKENLDRKQLLDYYANSIEHHLSPTNTQFGDRP